MTLLLILTLMAYLNSLCSAEDTSQDVSTVNVDGSGSKVPGREESKIYSSNLSNYLRLSRRSAMDFNHGKRQAIWLLEAAKNVAENAAELVKPNTDLSDENKEQLNEQCCKEKCDSEEVEEWMEVDRKAVTRHFCILHQAVICEERKDSVKLACGAGASPNTTAATSADRRI